MATAGQPELEAQLWLVGRVPVPLRRLYQREPLHAVKGHSAYCGYAGELEVQPLLWVDWAALTAIDGPEPCVECARLGVRRTERNGISLVELYSDRLTGSFEAIKERLTKLAPEPPAGHRWEYLIDVGRAQFEDGAGDFVRVWRSAAPDRPSKKRSLP